MSRPPEPLKVIAVKPFAPDSGEFTVEFETKSGQRFTCFAFGVEFQPGEEVTDAQFSLLEGETGFEGLCWEPRQEDVHREHRRVELPGVGSDSGPEWSRCTR